MSLSEKKPRMLQCHPCYRVLQERLLEWKEKNMNGNRDLGSEKLVPEDIQAIFVNVHRQVSLVIFLTTAGICS